MRTWTGRALPCLAVGVGLAIVGPLAAGERADLLIVDARVMTMNPRQPRASAVAIRDGRVAWVGESGEAARRFTGAARTLRLGGATVLPGIIDAHTHLQSLGESLLKLNVKDLATPEEV